MPKIWLIFFVLLLIIQAGCDGSSSSFLIDTDTSIECHTHDECPQYQRCIAKVCKFPKNDDYTSVMARITLPYEPSLSFLKKFDIPAGNSENDPDIIINLEKPVTFHGQIVQNEAWLLIPSRIAVSVVQDLSQPGLSHTLHSIAVDGKFQLTLLRGLKYRFVVFPNDTLLPQENFTLTLTSTHPDVYEHTFGYPSLNELTTIKGKVRPPKGIPIYDVAGLQVVGQSGNKFTSVGTVDNNREFMLKLHDRPQILTITISGNNTTISNFPTFTLPYSFESPKAIELPSFDKCNFGKLLGSVTGITSSYKTSAIPYAELQFSSFLSPNAYYQINVRADSNGEYKTDEFAKKLYPGNYRVKVFPPQDSSFLPQEFFIIVENQEDHERDCETSKFEKIQHFVISQGIEVSGNVVNPEGIPIAFASITASSLPAINPVLPSFLPPFKTTFTDSLGSYSFFLLKGDYQIEIRPPSQLEIPNQIQQISLSSSSQQKISSFTLLPPTYLLSAVYDHEKSPLKGVMIELYAVSSDNSSPTRFGDCITNEKGLGVIPIAKMITTHPQP